MCLITSLDIFAKTIIDNIVKLILYINRMNKQKSKLIAVVTVGLVCLGMISCKTNYYQVYDVKSNTLTQKDNSLVYENADVRVLYNLWSENGAIGFVFENKTDQDIFIDMGQTFFIKNGAANDYFKNREYSTTTTTNMSLGYSVSNEYLGSEGLWSSKYSVPTEVSPIANLMKGTSKSVIMKEAEFVCIPAKSWKIISEYEISPNFYLTCVKKNDYPKKSVNILSYTESTTPLIFKNRIAYSQTKDGNGLKHIENVFYLSGITNYSKKSAIMKSEIEDCYTGLKQIKYSFKIGGPDKFYKEYSK